jgi:hypothetical protein
VSDPTRIREAGSDVPDEVRVLFRSAAPPERLTPAVQAVLSRRVASIGKPVIRGPLWWLPWLLGSAAAVAGGAAYRARRAEAPHHALVKHAATPPAPVAPVVPAAAAPALAPAPPPRAEIARPVASPNPTTGEDGLVVEARLLNEAHQVLAADPKKALALARDHSRRYPHGQLAAERELIEIQALMKLGRRREAEARGETLRRTAPNSIYEERLDAILRER